MVRTLSTMAPLFSSAPDFRLPDTDGNLVSLHDFDGKPALLVMFICNHCPFVKHVRTKLAEVTKQWMKQGVAVVAINSNDVATHPDDAPAKMKEEAKSAGYAFPYLFDETQEVAKAYTAACTPDFFLYDRNRRLVYRGQMDGSRPQTDIPVTGEDLTRAIELTLKGVALDPNQRPSMGCNIKWKAGNAPPYFG